MAGFSCGRSSDIADRHGKNTEEKQPEEEAMAEAATKQGYAEDATQPGADSGVDSPVDTAQFAVKAASGSLMEVALGQMALQKGASQDVKQFAQTMITDHGKANAELEAWAKTSNMALPTAPLPQHQQHIGHLRDLSGAEFDKAYMGMMVADHQKTIAEFQQASQRETNAQLKVFAQKTLPVLKKHLDMAQKTHASVQKTTTKAK
jgi:putative membrane protein